MIRSLIVLLRRIAGLFNRDRRDADLDAEVQSLLEMHIEDGRRRGLSLADARLEARRAFGGIEPMKEAYRDQRGLPFVDALLQDARVAIRSFARGRRLAAAIVLTLAIGIGANAALFGVVDAVVLKPLPYREAARLMWITEGRRDFPTLNTGDFDAWKEQSRSFEMLAAVATQDVTLSGDPAVRVRMLASTEPIARVFGITPRLGRDFLADELRRSPANAANPSTGIAPGGAALLSERLFQSRFAGDASTLGKTIVLGRTSYTIVGVMPSLFRFPVGPLVRQGMGIRSDPDVFVTNQTGSIFAGVGLLKPGVTADAARSELRRIREDVDRSRPASQQTASSDLTVMPVHDRIVGSVRRPVLLLWAACGFVLLIACVNVASLLLARGASRRKEIAVRAALGAGRRRITRQLITESVIVASAGGIGGLAIAAVSLRILTRFRNLDVPRLADAAVDWRVFAFAVVACAIAGVTSGLAPSLVDSRSHPWTGLIAGGTIVSPSRARRRLQSILVVSEIAAASILLTGAGLMLKSLWVVRTQVDASSPDAVVSSRVEPYDPQLFERPADRTRFSSSLLDRIEALPGVTAAALWDTPYIFVAALEGDPAPPPGATVAALWVRVTRHFDRAAGLRVLAGRGLNARDDDANVPNVVVSESFARKLPSGPQFPAALVGRHLQAGLRRDDGRPWTIVGVVTDFRTGVTNGTPPDDDAASFAQVFYPNAVTPGNGGELLVRTAGDSSGLAASLRRIVAATPRVNLLEPRSLQDQILSTIAPRSFQTTLLIAFAAVAVALALVGIAGVLSHNVVERTREIGVRIAIGASRGEIRRMVLITGGRLVALGVIAGLIGSAALAPLLRGLLYRVAPTDALTYAAVCGLLIAVCIFAAYVPARRAMLVSPLEAMRYE